MKGAAVSDDLVANLFNPDPLLRETSAWIIHQIDSKAFELCSTRITTSLRKETDEKIKQASQNKNSLLIEQIFLLKQIKQFSKVPGIVLAEMGKNLFPQFISEEQVLLKKQNDKRQTIYILAEGNAFIKNNNGVLLELGKNQLIGEMLLLHSDSESTEVVIAKDSLLYELPYDKSMELVYNHSEFAEALLNNTDERLQQEAVAK